MWEAVARLVIMRPKSSGRGCGVPFRSFVPEDWVLSSPRFICGKQTHISMCLRRPPIGQEGSSLLHGVLRLLEPVS